MWQKLGALVAIWDWVWLSSGWGCAVGACTKMLVAAVVTFGDNAIIAGKKENVGIIDLVSTKHHPSTFLHLYCFILPLLLSVLLLLVMVVFLEKGDVLGLLGHLLVGKMGLQ